ncbi:hypothetical protein CAPTEDRAFT_184859 [Capitella teleta]|uniref:CARD domain-containing protein n=1 Tax=Capitella teleta TaxID=283909 RepID=X1ZH65_CAPTE|nr:hypothetical protein CAPTEDRAFT_184859 [Capitella teleta]|eukprot:ELT90073.1 hypothetical protein CAPTEDRAFT_184859 [Capitella teleta]
MGKGSDATSQRRGLRDTLRSHRSDVIRQLDSNTLFLSCLAKYKLIDENDILRYEKHKRRSKRNEDVIDGILRHEEEVPDSYDKFLEALRRSDQDKLANMITSIENELDIVDDYQTKLEEHLDDVHKYLSKERRRTEIDFETKAPTESVKPKQKKALDVNNRAEMSEFLQKVQTTTKSTLIHFDRCKEVIEKLHGDCNSVALKNAELLSKLRDCDEMVGELVPEHKRMKAEPVERDDTRLSRVNSSRTKRTEAEMLVKSIRRKLVLIEDDQLKQVDSNKISEGIIDNIMEDVEQRTAVLEKQTEHPPRDKSGMNKYMVGIDGAAGDKSSRSSTRFDPLRVKVEQLAEALEVYVHQEKQVTHKINLTKYQTGGVSHRNFDAIDEDLIILRRELKKEDQGKAMDVARHIVEATKAERADCLKMVDELQKTVKTRRLKLQEVASRVMGPTLKRRIPQRRVRAAKKSDSSFSKRLNDLNNEIRMYMKLELDQNQRNQAELLKKKQEHEAHSKNQAHKMKKLEKNLKDLEGERGKFKRLYQQEKSAQKSQILKRPTLVGRRSRARVIRSPSQSPSPRRARRSPSQSPTPRTSRRTPSHSPTPRKSFYTPLPRDDSPWFDDRDDEPKIVKPKKNSARRLGPIRATTKENLRHPGFDDREEDLKRTKPKKQSARVMGPVRTYTRDNFSDREETPPDSRVRNRSRVRHLTPARNPENSSRFPSIHDRK